VALARQTDWDLFFVTFLTLDRVQHFYWRFQDRTDPTYPTDRTHPREGDPRNAIFEHYRLLDEVVGRLLNCQPPDCATLVLSDHGHGRRPTRLFHLNEWLRREGLLDAPAGAANPFAKARLLEFAKRTALQGARGLALEDVAFSLAQLIPRAKRQALRRGDFPGGNRASLARRDSFGGNSPYGGIRLSEEAARAAGLSVEAVRLSLTRTLARIRDPLTGERIAEWVAPREALVRGAHADAFPELLYQLRPNWGTDPSLFGSPFSHSPLHRRLSGGHRPDGVLFASEAAAGALSEAADLPRLGALVCGLLAG
jgi:predicted AlkP superfamily phosphohydrolase/phosphomutase